MDEWASDDCNEGGGEGSGDEWARDEWLEDEAGGVGVAGNEGWVGVECGEVALVLVVGEEPLTEDRVEGVGVSGESGGVAVALANRWTASETLKTVLSSNLSSSSCV